MRYLTVILIIALSVISAAVSIASESSDKNRMKDSSNNIKCYVVPKMSGKQVSAFVAKVWDKNRWKRNKVKKSTIRFYNSLKNCSPARSPIIKKKWNTARKIFYRHSKKMEYWHKITPYKGGGKRWAIPYYIVVCESGARLNSAAAPSGAYGLLRSTWHQFRSKRARKYHMPYVAPKIEQDKVAHILWKRYGGSPWTCA